METPLLPGYYLRFSIFRWIGWHMGQATGSAVRGIEDGYRDAAGTGSGMLSRALLAVVLILLAAIFVAFLSPAHAALCLVSLGILVILFRVRMPGSVRALLYFLVGSQVAWGLLGVVHRFTGNSHPRLEVVALVGIPTVFVFGLIGAVRYQPAKTRLRS